MVIHFPFLTFCLVVFRFFRLLSSQIITISVVTGAGSLAGYIMKLGRGGDEKEDLADDIVAAVNANSNNAATTGGGGLNGTEQLGATGGTGDGGVSMGVGTGPNGSSSAWGHVSHGTTPGGGPVGVEGTTIGVSTTPAQTMAVTSVQQTMAISAAKHIAVSTAGTAKAIASSTAFAGGTMTTMGSGAGAGTFAAVFGLKGTGATISMITVSALATVAIAGTTYYTVSDRANNTETTTNNKNDIQEFPIIPTSTTLGRACLHPNPVVRNDTIRFTLDILDTSNHLKNGDKSGDINSIGIPFIDYINDDRSTITKQLWEETFAAVYVFPLFDFYILIIILRFCYHFFFLCRPYLFSLFLFFP